MRHLPQRNRSLVCYLNMEFNETYRDIGSVVGNNLCGFQEGRSSLALAEVCDFLSDILK